MILDRKKFDGCFLIVNIEFSAFGHAETTLNKNSSRFVSFSLVTQYGNNRHILLFFY